MEAYEGKASGMEVEVVGLLMSLGGFVSFGEAQGGYAADLLDRLEALAMDVALRHGMTLIKINDGDILLVGHSQEEALGVAFGFTEEFERSLPEQGHLPVHVAVHPGELMELDDGQTVELAAHVTATAHPGETRPVLRG